MGRRSVIAFALLVLVGCVVEDIAIDVLYTDKNLEFAFHTGILKKPVALIDIRITSNTGTLIWDLATYDRSQVTSYPSLVHEKQGDQFILKEREDIPELNAQIVSRLIFGKVPEGFTQYYPRQDQVPILGKNQTYEIFVTGVGHRGRAQFAVN